MLLIFLSCQGSFCLKDQTRNIKKKKNVSLSMHIPQNMGSIAFFKSIAQIVSSSQIPPPLPSSFGLSKESGEWKLAAGELLNDLRAKHSQQLMLLNGNAVKRLLLFLFSLLQYNVNIYRNNLS